MKRRCDDLYAALMRFVGGSPAGFLQVLVAAAGKSTFQRIIACPTYPVPARFSGLSSAVEQFRELISCNYAHVPSVLARLYSSVRDLPYRKVKGQFFTAESVASWALSVRPLKQTDVVCDAGVGTGVFAEAILRCGPAVTSYVGVESDPVLALCAAHVLEHLHAPETFKIWYANFLLLKKEDFASVGPALPNVVIANPPFVRFHNLTGRARIRAALKSSLGVTLSALAGASSYFIARAADIVSTGNPGTRSSDNRLLFFLPQEASGAAHVQQLLRHLQARQGWRWHEYAVPEEPTGVDSHPSNALALFFAFEQRESRNEPRPRSARPAVPLREILRVKRGISTGFNEFFILTDQDVRQRGIPGTRLKKVLPTRIPLPRDCFSRAHWEQLRASGHACWLLTLPGGDIEDFEEPIRQYLKEGLQRGVHETPTARSYKSWFSIPVPSKPADLFATYLFRGAPRFVVNEAQVLHLTNILGGYFDPTLVDEDRHQAITKSLNKQALHWADHSPIGRQYKGGLMKIEPRELSQMPIKPSLFRLVNRTKRHLVSQTLFD